MSREYLAEFNRIGGKRFGEAVGRVIRESGLGFFPAVGEFLVYVPQVTQTWGIPEDEYKALKADREVRPDEYFGEADVVCMMRIKMAEPRMPFERLIQEVLETRQMAMERSNAKR